MNETPSFLANEGVSFMINCRTAVRGFSAYVAQAVARQLERDTLDDVLARMEAEHGPVDENEVRDIMGRLAG